MPFLKTEITASVLRIVDATTKKLPVEDLFVELKAEWCDPKNLDELKGWARQLGGQANAARGQSVLWIIGVKQRVGVWGNGAQDIELADFMAQLRKCFSGEAPNATDLAVQLDDGKRVLALHFETGNPPYVIKEEPQKKDSKLEVPWRDVTGTRSASRNELIQMLEPRAKLPQIDLLSGNVHARYNQHDRNFMVKAEVRIFVAPNSGGGQTLVAHRTQAVLKWGNVEYSLMFKKFLKTEREPRDTVTVSDDAAVFLHPSIVGFEAFAYPSGMTDIPSDVCPSVVIDFATFPAEIPVRIAFIPELETRKPDGGMGMPNIVEAKFRTRS